MTTQAPLRLGSPAPSTPRGPDATVWVPPKNMFGPSHNWLSGHASSTGAMRSGSNPPSTLNAPLIAEAVQSPSEGGLVVAAGTRADPQVGAAHGALDGQVLLDGGLPAVAFVDRKVGDAEAASAEHPLNAVMRKPAAGRQCVVVTHKRDSPRRPVVGPGAASRAPQATGPGRAAGDAQSRPAA